MGQYSRLTLFMHSGPYRHMYSYGTVFNANAVPDGPYTHMYSCGTVFNANAVHGAPYTHVLLRMSTATCTNRSPLQFFPQVDSNNALAIKGLHFNGVWKSDYITHFCAVREGFCAAFVR